MIPINDSLCERGIHTLKGDSPMCVLCGKDTTKKGNDMAALQKEQNGNN